ncbi:MAG: hypothetical protein AAGG44_10945, partial [Planctomycetota bacterium]
QLMNSSNLKFAAKPSRRQPLLSLAVAIIVLSSGSVSRAQEDPIFSGPQVEEKLPSFEAMIARGSEKGEDSKAGEATKAPTLIVFWHELGRPGFALLRTLSEYSLSLEPKGMQTRVVILTDDLDSSRFGGALRLLPENLTVLTAEGGKDGPGSFGLNRDVRMTILVAKDQKILGNFALIQPSVQADGPKIIQAIADAVGEEPPTLESLLQKGRRRMQRGDSAQTDRAMRPAQSAKLTTLLRKMLQAKKDEDIESVAAEIESLIEKDKAARSDLARRANTIVTSGRVERYGTAKTQEYIQAWAKKLKAESESKQSQDKETAETNSSGTP